MKIEEKLALGVQLIRIITRKDASRLTQIMREGGYAVTSIQAEGSTGKVGILYSIVNRKSIQDVINVIQKHNPKAFYTIEDIRFVSQQIKEDINSPCK